MRPELPFLAAGAVSITGAAVKEKHWPANAGRAVIGTVALVIVSSAAADTALAPLVHAIGLLILLVAVMSAIRLNQKAK